MCSPGIPWNLDISLLALIYIGIGFYYKEKILLYLNSDNQKSDFFALLVLGISTLFCIVNYVGRDEPFYYFDMKQLYYKELFSVVVIPCAFGIILARLVHWGMKCSISTGLSYLGQMTVPIMFMHIPLNKILSNISGNMMKNDRIVFCIIGIGGPVLITIVFSKYKTMRKLFGLPKI